MEKAYVGFGILQTVRHLLGGSWNVSPTDQGDNYIIISHSLAIVCDLYFLQKKFPKYIKAGN